MPFDIPLILNSLANGSKANVLALSNRLLPVEFAKSAPLDRAPARGVYNGPAGRGHKSKVFYG